MIIASGAANVPLIDEPRAIDQMLCVCVCVCNRYVHANALQRDLCNLLLTWMEKSVSLSCVVRESQTQVVFTSVTLPADCSETV